ncbi:ATP synthase subunit I [Diaphorobacter caeni]|uniref:ATP synthase subunit I n=1 Tax=Diaphorobacter caeni TaxID=2784387 RepID=UPI0018901DE2|nr:ATP synthase subunit I [Diaphorobacter caeni]MBF5005564.1 ATP synthase subunit I [Diaphorobacter caeni]
MNKDMTPETETEVEDSDFKPLTAQEAQEWRARHKTLSIWWIVMAQALVGVAAVLVAWLVSSKAQIAYSVAYGSLSVVIPSLVFARGLARGRGGSAGGAMVGLFGWELVKILLTVAMLAAAPRIVAGVSWLALLIGMVVTMKAYWVALLVRRSK